MNKLKIAAAVVLTLASAASFAQSNDVGFYGLANFGFTMAKGEGSGQWDDGTKTTSSSDGAGNSWNLGLGYDIDKNFAVEATYGSFWKQKDNYTEHAANGVTQINNKKTDVMSLSITGLVKYQLSPNTRLFAGPTVAFLRLKGANEQSYDDNNGSYSYSSSSSFNKTLPGLMIGSSFALDQKTDLRVSYTKYKTWVMGNAPYTEDNRISNLSFGISIKF